MTSLSALSDIPKKADNPPRVRLLTPLDIPAFLSLQCKVLGALPPDKRHYLKPRTDDDLKAHLDAGMPMLGVHNPMNPTELWGQSLLSYAVFEDALKNINGYPFKSGDPGVAVLQSVAVSPDAPVKNLGAALVEAAKDMAAMRGMGKIWAKISDDNRPSRRLFLSKGFERAVSGTDPAKGHRVGYYCHYIGVCSAAQPIMA